MKYYLILIAIISVTISCKTKKEIVQSNAVGNSVTKVTDTFYLENRQSGDVTMLVSKQKESPAGKWSLHTIDDINDPEVSRVTMSINDKEKSVSGYDGCNNYSGNLTQLSPNEIEFGPMASTKRACIVPAEYAEMLYETLTRVKMYQASEDYLILRDESNKPVLIFKRKLDD